MPSALDIVQHLVENPPESEYFTLEKAAYILSLFQSETLNKTNNNLDQQEKFEGYINLNAELIEEVIGTRYASPVMRWWINTGVVEKRPGYFPGKYSIRYRLNAKYISDPKPFRIISKSVVKRRPKGDVHRTKKLSHLKSFWDERLKIDGAAARNKIEELSRQNYSEENEDEKRRKYQFRSNHIILVDLIERADFTSFHTDGTAGRLHTPLTRLNTDLRPFLTFDDQKLVEVDIKNSQPFFAMALFNPKVFDDLGVADRIRNYNLDFDEERYRKKYLGVMNTSFISDVTKCLIYESFRDRINETGNKKFDRDDAKLAYMLAAYSAPWLADKSKKVQIFAQAYPFTADAFNFIKTGERIGPKVKKKAGKDASVALACVLQSIEADVMLFNVCGRLEKEYPEIPLFTIHDSIMTTKGNEEIVKQVMIEEIEKVIRFRPKVETKSS